MNAMLLFGVGITVLLVLFVGMYIGRKVEGDSQNFLVAGRMLPIYLVAPALMVAAVDSNATVGNMDPSSSSGFWTGASLAIGLAIALLLSGIFIAKPMNEMGLFSLGDFFRVKYGRAFEKLAAAQGVLLSVAEAFGQAASSVTVAVCGQHMRGFALHSQLEDLGAEFLGAARTAPTYRLFALPGTLVKPGLLRSAPGGASIEVELCRMSAAAFGALVASAPAPLGFGSVELEDGSEVNGFLVEASAVVGAGGEPLPNVQEITDLGSFAAFCS